MKIKIISFLKFEKNKPSIIPSIDIQIIYVFMFKYNGDKVVFLLLFYLKIRVFLC